MPFFHVQVKISNHAHASNLRVWTINEFGFLNAVYSYPCFKELLQHLKLLRGPGTCVFWSDFELQCLVVLWVQSHAALEYIRLEHDHPRLIRVHNR